ncbi:MAG TPA: alkaline phosphatase family protein, partial [Clostridia bacterium]
TSLGELHPSELNYIFMESGTVTFSDHSFTTDNDPSAKNSTSSLNHLVTLLEKNGFTWKSYQEGISGTDCPITTNNLYAPKHNPSLFFQDVSGNPPSSDNTYCRDDIRPFSELKDDISSGNLPNYVFITPNLNNDMHSGTVAQADTWLSQTVPLITSSSVYKKDGAVFITWDEGSENKETQDAVNNNAIGMIILSPFVKKGYTNSTEYSHASLLKTVEELFHLTPLLGLANDNETKDLFDFFNTNK